MGWHNPPRRWGEYHRDLSEFTGTGPDRPGTGSPGGDRPAPVVRIARPPREPRATGRVTVPTTTTRTRYAELHAHSNFSFLDGASPPEELAEEAGRLGIESLALTDHDGLYGVVRFAEAAEAVGVRTLFGAELSVELTEPRAGAADPASSHLLVLARDPEGYRRLSRAISNGHRLGGAKGRPAFDLDELAALAGGRWLILTGCRKGLVPAALASGGPEAAAGALDRLVGLFGRDNIAVELWDHGHPLDSVRDDALWVLGDRAGVQVVATTNAHYAAPGRAHLAAALAAIRARRGLDEMDGWLPPAGTAHLRGGDEMAERFARYPGAVDRAAALGRECSFSLELVRPRLPRFSVPDGYDEVSYLRLLTEHGATAKYGTRDEAPAAYAQIDHELDVIAAQGFPGYFLIVWDIVEYCRRSRILCQGRGSAANSAVCYALGITCVDAVRFGLLFERFLSTERDGPPDIDLDIESERREEVIQYVYKKYGRDHAAQVANVITYQQKSAVRDLAMALGYAPGQRDAWSRQVNAYGSGEPADDHDIPDLVLDLADQARGYPRHLGIHSGGMVLCDRPVVDVCPVEWARMPGRSVLQWDKDDCAATRLVKFDLLGLGMLTALRLAFELIEDHYGERFTLDSIPTEDPEVYDMLCAADSVGVFQVESRAQMATLPRLRPREFYDLVIEVALIRPGPIQGGSVHPYIRRANGTEPITYLHPLLEGALAKTKGVPLFQEQVMRIAIDAAGFTPAESDRLRLAMSSKRSAERLERLRPRLISGMAERGIPSDVAELIYQKMIAFADYGFPESHAMSFAYLVYASAWLKLRYPAAFCAALLNAQPMGFYSPQSLVADARRHGVTVRGPDVNASAAGATLEPDGDGFAVRLGLSSVRHVGAKVAERIADARPYQDPGDLVTRADLERRVVESLATAGALGCFGLDRREALWVAGAAVRDGWGSLPLELPSQVAPVLPAMTDEERAVADLWATGISPGSFPTQFQRDRLERMGVVTAERLRRVPGGRRVLTAGVVTHRQRPSTAGGTVFINLEDETGFANIICPPGVWRRYRREARDSAALVVRGTVENAEGVVNVLAERLGPLSLAHAGRSRDFR